MNQLSDNIKDLRNKTGAGFLDCKKALLENDNDIDNSINYLRKKGLAKASKKYSRDAKEGAVGCFSNETKTVLLEINTETDFAAKNEVFLNFFENLGNKILINFSDLEGDINIDDITSKIVDKEKISDLLDSAIAKIGENIILKKIYFINKSSDTQIYTYTHNSYRKNIGKICVILKAKTHLNEETTLLGKNLCMHIAALKPLSIDIDNLDKKLIQNERNIQIETINSSGKSKEIIDKILNGKMQKYYSEVTLLNQKYVLDDKKNIKEIIEEFNKSNSFEILDYKLFILGSE
ncbi:MAG: Elongation factor Ts [Alphaproteobacteria bacterium MarineAlpha5_Bin9]|nr:MAG: Elongation factor Ts [Alphaproteobacteria bacterium MarineAlpha5_Bin9]